MEGLTDTSSSGSSNNGKQQITTGMKGSKKTAWIKDGSNDRTTAPDSRPGKMTKNSAKVTKHLLVTLPKTNKKRYKK